MSYPVYYKEPIRWLRYYAHNRPHLFFAGCIAVMGPAMLVTITPLRRRFLYDDLAPLPLDGYPIPKGPRKKVTGYDD
ncbi:putative membrane protein [Ogataea parapolymorpha DL-1]|uniref:Membrane protein n=1 Tax=Ogataea parapolymorpha (strain ATCC 26012 / BCRC 20466 / JCM 22074 / NRRL Y-7560 / DL-1) TaxID=871575 RepID=W1QJ35_OGAPD|nr:putative membrane protein [Ogataea parapolymorpha DL-1]ESX00979.1 putative membrane protein [Ogataea parapolymorpha DL-1]